MTEDWEKTVLTDEEIVTACGLLSINYRKIAKAQAKVAYQAGIQKGRQEVVDFVVSDIFPLLNRATVYLNFIDKWNNKVKEWLG